MNTLQKLNTINIPTDSFNVSGERFFISMEDFLNSPHIKRLGINRDEKLRVEKGMVQGLFEPRADNLNVTLVEYNGEDKLTANNEIEISKGDIVVVDANTRRHVWRKMINEGLMPNPESFMKNYVLVSLEKCNSIDELERLYETYDSKNSFKTPKNYLESIQERLGLTVKEMTGVTSMMKRSINVSSRKTTLINGKPATQVAYDEMVLTKFGAKYITEFTNFISELEEKYGTKKCKVFSKQRSSFLWVYRTLRDTFDEITVKQRLELFLQKTSIKNNNDETRYDKVAFFFMDGSPKFGGYLNPKATSDKVPVVGGYLYITLLSEDKDAKANVVSDTINGKERCMETFHTVNRSIWGE